MLSMGTSSRPEVPQAWVRRLDGVLSALPGCGCGCERAWVGTRRRVGTATVAHVFGGEDQLFRVVFRAELDEVMAFEHLGAPARLAAGQPVAVAESVSADVTSTKSVPM